MTILLAITTYQPQIFIFYIGEVGTILYILPTCRSFFLPSSKKEGKYLNMLNPKSSSEIQQANFKEKSQFKEWHL